jgi:hypothetical protein
LTRECEQHSELRPGSGVATLDYKPHMDGLKLHPSAKPNAAEQAVADYCNDCIDLDSLCDCLQACGSSEELLANPRCPVCGGTGRPSVKTLVAGIDALNCEIDQLAGTAADICTPVKAFLDLAWWHTEEAIRRATGACSMRCKPGGFCACCHHYEELKAKAQRIGRVL